MDSAKPRRAVDRSGTAVSRPAEIAIDPQPLVGTWMNTNNATRGITQVVLAVRDGGLVVRAFGACDPASCDWGSVNVAVFAGDADSVEGNAFNAFYDFGFMETHLQSHIRQGVLVVAKFDRFKDDSGRANYFSKEFFFRADE
jgi:hypothetical protein